MQLLVQGQLKKRHSLVLYEYLQDEIGRSGAKLVEIEDVKIDFLLKLFGLEGETYQQFKYLQRDVLKPAVKEINTFSDVSVDYKAVRKGRKTVGVDFTVTREESFQLALNLDEKTTGAEFGAETEAQLIERLKQKGMSEKVAVGVVKKYSAERIGGNIAYLENELQSGTKIQNRGAWLRRAIEQDWRPVKTEVEKEKIEALKRQQEEREKEERKELEKDFKKFRYKRAGEVFRAKSKTFQTRRCNAFLEKMRQEENGVVLNAYKSDGLDSPMFFNCLVAELLNELLTEEHETSIAGYEAWRKAQDTGGAKQKTAAAKR